MVPSSSSILFSPMAMPSASVLPDSHSVAEHYLCTIGAAVGGGLGRATHVYLQLRGARHRYVLAEGHRHLDCIAGAA